MNEITTIADFQLLWNVEICLKHCCFWVDNILQRWTQLGKFHCVFQELHLVDWRFHCYLRLTNCQDFTHGQLLHASHRSCRVLVHLILVSGTAFTGILLKYFQLVQTAMNNGASSLTQFYILIISEDEDDVRSNVAGMPVPLHARLQAISGQVAWALGHRKNSTQDKEEQKTGEKGG